MYDFPYYWRQFLDYWPEKLSISAIFGTASSFFGGDAFLWNACFGMLTADLFFGLWAAVKTKTFSHAVLERGIAKFPAYAIYIILTSVLEMTAMQAFSMHLPLLNIILAYLVFTDSISILQHLKNLGLPVPPLLEAIAQRGKTKIEMAVQHDERMKH